MDESGVRSERPKLLYIVTAPVSVHCLLRGQLQFMQQQGFDVVVISAPGALLHEAARREGVCALEVPMDREPSPLSDLRGLMRLTREIRKLKPHIVHFSTPKAGLLGSIAATLAGVPIRLYTLRGMRADGLQGFSAFALTMMEKLPCGLADEVICVSESLRTRARELRIASEKKLRVLDPQSSNGVDVIRFSRTTATMIRAEQLRQELQIPLEAKVIGFVGRLCEDKGGRELIEAFCRLRQTDPSIHLLCVGPDETSESIPEAVRSLMREDRNIHSTGSLEDPTFAYPLIDVLALPTYREGFPNVVLEAAAMEIPVVATRVTGCIDAVVDGITGTLVPARDSESLASALGQYLESESLRRLHGKNGRQRAQLQFSQHQVWTALYNLYLELLTKRGCPLPRIRLNPGAQMSSKQSNIVI